MSKLMLHAGSRTVDRNILATIDAPPATDTWFPVAHRDVIETAESLLVGSGFAIARTRYGLSPDQHRFFAVLDLTLAVGSDGIALAVGVRNSTDKTFPIGLCAGTRVFVCENLAFSAEMTVNRKHTRFGMDRWREGIGLAVKGLDQFQQAESRRISVLQETDLGRAQADSLILTAFEAGILNSRQLPDAIAQWRNPSFDWGRPGTAWHAYNALTHALGDSAARNPQKHAGLTMRLMQHFAGFLGSDGAALMTPGPTPAQVPTLRDDDRDTVYTDQDDEPNVNPNPFENRYAVRDDDGAIHLPIDGADILD